MKNIRELVLETIDGRVAYIGGDIIRGELYISLEEAVHMKSIKIYLYGEGAGSWLQQNHTDNDHEKDSDGKVKKRVLIDVGLLVFGFAEDNDEQTDKHEYGRYLYTFEFSIPKNIAPSFKSPVEKDLGYAKYCLKAVVSRPRKYDKIARQTIIINELIDPDQPQLLFQPGSYQENNVTTACMPSGKLQLESYLNRSYYTQGESILINAVAENDSTKIMKEIYAKLIRRVRCKSRFGTNTYITEEANIHGERIPAQEQIAWKNQMMKVPAVGPTITGNFHDIKVDYIVRIGMFEDMGSEIHLDLPVVIGTIGKKDTKDDSDDEGSTVEDGLYDRDKNDYGLQVIKANDRDKHRKALKDKISSSLPQNDSDEPHAVFKRDPHALDKQDPRASVKKNSQALTKQDPRASGKKDSHALDKQEPSVSVKKDSHALEKPESSALAKKDPRGLDNQDTRGLNKKEPHAFGKNDDDFELTLDLEHGEPKDRVEIFDEEINIATSDDDVEAGIDADDNFNNDDNRSKSAASGRPKTSTVPARSSSADGGRNKSPVKNKGLRGKSTSPSRSQGSLEGSTDPLNKSLDGTSFPARKGEMKNGKAGDKKPLSKSTGSLGPKKGSSRGDDNSVGGSTGYLPGSGGSTGSLRGSKSGSVGGSTGSLRGSKPGSVGGSTGSLSGSKPTPSKRRSGKTSDKPSKERPGSLSDKPGDLKESSIKSSPTEVSKTAKDELQQSGPGKGSQKGIRGINDDMEDPNIARDHSDGLRDSTEDLIQDMMREQEPQVDEGEEVCQVRSEDEVQAGVDEEAFLKALGDEITGSGKNKGNKPIGSYIGDESPIIPSERKDDYAGVDEEEFLKEFEKLEEAFESESPSMKHRQIPVEHAEEHDGYPDGAEDYYHHSMPPIKEENEDQTERKRAERNQRKQPQQMAQEASLPSSKELGKEKSPEKDSYFDKMHTANDPKNIGKTNEATKDDGKVGGVGKDAGKADGEGKYTGKVNGEGKGEGKADDQKSEKKEDDQKPAINPWGLVGMIGRLLGKKKKQDEQNKPQHEQNDDPNGSKQKVDGVDGRIEQKDIPGDAKQDISEDDDNKTLEAGSAGYDDGTVGQNETNVPHGDIIKPTGTGLDDDATTGKYQSKKAGKPYDRKQTDGPLQEVTANDKDADRDRRVPLDKHSPSHKEYHSPQTETDQIPKTSKRQNEKVPGSIKQSYPKQKDDLKKPEMSDEDNFDIEHGDKVEPKGIVDEEINIALSDGEVEAGLDDDAYFDGDNNRSKSAASGRPKSCSVPARSSSADGARKKRPPKSKGLHDQPSPSSRSKELIYPKAEKKGKEATGKDPAQRHSKQRAVDGPTDKVRTEEEDGSPSENVLDDDSLEEIGSGKTKAKSTAKSPAKVPEAKSAAKSPADISKTKRSVKSQGMASKPSGKEPKSTKEEKTSSTPKKTDQPGKGKKPVPVRTPTKSSKNGSPDDDKRMKTKTEPKAAMSRQKDGKSGLKDIRIPSGHSEDEILRHGSSDDSFFSSHSSSYSDSEENAEPLQSRDAKSEQPQSVKTEQDKNMPIGSRPKNDGLNERSKNRMTPKSGTAVQKQKHKDTAEEKGPRTLSSTSTPQTRRDTPGKPGPIQRNKIAPEEDEGYGTIGRKKIGKKLPSSQSENKNLIPKSADKKSSTPEKKAAPSKNNEKIQKALHNGPSETPKERKSKENKLSSPEISSKHDPLKDGKKKSSSKTNTSAPSSGIPHKSSKEREPVKNNLGYTPERQIITSSGGEYSSQESDASQSESETQRGIQKQSPVKGEAQSAKGFPSESERNIPPSKNKRVTPTKIHFSPNTKSDTSGNDNPVSKGQEKKYDSRGHPLKPETSPSKRRDEAEPRKEHSSGQQSQQAPEKTKRSKSPSKSKPTSLKSGTSPSGKGITGAPEQTLQGKQGPSRGSSQVPSAEDRPTIPSKNKSSAPLSGKRPTKEDAQLPVSKHGEPLYGSDGYPMTPEREYLPTDSNSSKSESGTDKDFSSPGDDQQRYDDGKKHPERIERSKSPTKTQPTSLKSGTSPSGKRITGVPEQTLKRKQGSSQGSSQVPSAEDRHTVPSGHKGSVPSLGSRSTKGDPQHSVSKHGKPLYDSHDYPMTPEREYLPSKSDSSESDSGPDKNYSSAGDDQQGYDDSKKHPERIERSKSPTKTQPTSLKSGTSPSAKRITGVPEQTLKSKQGPSRGSSQVPSAEDWHAVPSGHKGSVPFLRTKGGAQLPVSKYGEPLYDSHGYRMTPEREYLPSNSSNSSESESGTDTDKDYPSPGDHQQGYDDGEKHPERLERSKSPTKTQPTSLKSGTSPSGKKIMGVPEQTLKSKQGPSRGSSQFPSAEDRHTVPSGHRGSEPLLGSRSTKKDPHHPVSKHGEPLYDSHGYPMTREREYLPSKSDSSESDSGTDKDYSSPADDQRDYDYGKKIPDRIGRSKSPPKARATSLKGSTLQSGKKTAGVPEQTLQSKHGPAHGSSQVSSKHKGSAPLSGSRSTKRDPQHPISNHAEPLHNSHGYPVTPERKYLPSQSNSSEPESATHKDYSSPGYENQGSDDVRQHIPERKNRSNSPTKPKPTSKSGTSSSAKRTTGVPDHILQKKEPSRGSRQMPSADDPHTVPSKHKGSETLPGSTSTKEDPQRSMSDNRHPIKPERLRSPSKSNRQNAFAEDNKGNMPNYDNFGYPTTPKRHIHSTGSKSNATSNGHPISQNISHDEPRYGQYHSDPKDYMSPSKTKLVVPTRGSPASRTGQHSPHLVGQQPTYDSRGNLIKPEHQLLLRSDPTPLGRGTIGKPHDTLSTGQQPQKRPAISSTPISKKSSPVDSRIKGEKSNTISPPRSKTTRDAKHIPSDHPIANYDNRGFPISIGRASPKQMSGVSKPSTKGEQKFPSSKKDSKPKYESISPSSTTPKKTKKDTGSTTAKLNLEKQRMSTTPKKIHSKISQVPRSQQESKIIPNYCFNNSPSRQPYVSPYRQQKVPHKHVLKAPYATDLPEENDIEQPSMGRLSPQKEIFELESKLKQGVPKKQPFSPSQSANEERMMRGMLEQVPSNQLEPGKDQIAPGLDDQNMPDAIYLGRRKLSDLEPADKKKAVTQHPSDETHVRSRLPGVKNEQNPIVPSHGNQLIKGILKPKRTKSPTRSLPRSPSPSFPQSNIPCSHSFDDDNGEMRGSAGSRSGSCPVMHNDNACIESRGPILPYVGHIERLDRSHSREEIEDFLDDLSTERQPVANSEITPKQPEKFDFILIPPYAVETVILPGPTEEITIEMKLEEMPTDKTEESKQNAMDKRKNKPIIDAHLIQPVEKNICANGDGNTDYERVICESSLVLPEVPTKENQRNTPPDDNLTLPDTPRKPEDNKDSMDSKEIPPTIAPIENREKVKVPVNYLPMIRSPPSPKKKYNNRPTNTGEQGSHSIVTNKRPRSISPTKSTKIDHLKRSRSASPGRNKTPKPKEKPGKEKIKGKKALDPNKRSSVPKEKQSTKIPILSPRDGSTNKQINPVRDDDTKDIGRNKDKTGQQDIQPQMHTLERMSSLDRSHDERVFMGGGLIFHSPNKKSLKSPRTKNKKGNTPYDRKTTPETTKTKLKVSKSKPKKLPPRARPKSIEPIPTQENEVMPHKERYTREVNPEMFEGKLQEEMRKSNIKENIFTEPKTSCGFDGRTRQPVSYIIPATTKKEKKRKKIPKNVDCTVSNKQTQIDLPPEQKQSRDREDQQVANRPRGQPCDWEDQQVLGRYIEDSSVKLTRYEMMQKQLLQKYETTIETSMGGDSRHNAAAETQIHHVGEPKFEETYTHHEDQNSEGRIIIKRKAPKSAVRPLEQTSNDKSASRILSTKTPEWYSQMFPAKDVHYIAPPQSRLHVPPSPSRLHGRPIDESFDSFEYHEKNFGIIDEQGNVKSNNQLLQIINQNRIEYDEKERRNRRRHIRKNKRLMDELNVVKRERSASCPPAIGTREGLFEFPDDMYHDINSSETGTEYTIDYEQIEDEYDQIPWIDGGIRYRHTPPAVETHYFTSKNKPQTTTHNKKTKDFSNGEFGFEEEVIETYQFIEERPHKP